MTIENLFVYDEPDGCRSSTYTKLEKDQTKFQLNKEIT
jgi:hypothetical protein